MKYMHSEWRGRVDHWLNTVKKDIYLPLQDLSLEGFTTNERLSVDEAAKGPFVPMPEGTRWGKSYEYAWFRTTITLPKEAQGKRIAMDLNAGGEACVFIDRKSFGTYRMNWVKEPLHYIVDNYLPYPAQEGQRYEIMLETYAGHYIAQSELEGCSTGPILPGSYQDDKVEGQRTHVHRTSFGIWNEEAYQLYMDAQTLYFLIDEVNEESLRAASIADALEQFTLKVDFEQNLEGRLQSYAEGRKALKPALEAVNGSTVPDFYAIGNAHLDLAWLWTMEETRRKTSRTFSAQLRLLDEYPDYRFLQSQPASYAMCKECYPELYERIKEAVKRGQWIAEGAMWAEPDTNMASGEALIRQIVHGKRFFKEEFGVDSVLLWLPDTFGYSAALPQILKACGVKYLVTQKIFWSYNEGDRFPYHYFTWQGADGSHIDTFLPTSYTYRTDPKEICETWKGRAQKRHLDAFLFPCGYGDGGGGPCRDYIESVLREKDLEGMPRVHFENPVRFFEEMEKKHEKPHHRYVGELYFSAHRGVFTSQAAVKRGNRKSESAMRESEIWGSIALSLKGFDFPYPLMDSAWKKLLLNQFHDILPGSSIAAVYDDAKRDHASIIADAESCLENAHTTLATAQAKGVSVYNSLSFAREGVVELPAEFAQGAKSSDGDIIPVQSHNGKVLALVRTPSMGAISLYPDHKSAGYEQASAAYQDGLFILENELVRAVINAQAEVVSFVLKESGREFAEGPMNHLMLFKDVPRLFDAWDIDSNYIDQEIPVDGDVQISILNSSGLRAGLFVSRKINKSLFTQEIRLDAGSLRLDFITQVDWHEKHRLLKTAFPIRVQAEEGINEIQFGYMKHPTHSSRVYDSDRFEVCNQRYSALADQNHGAAILNDCKYGISMKGNELRLSLLRAATCPDFEADQGDHSFTYSLMAWEGPFISAPVVQEAYALNNPLFVAQGAQDSFSAFILDEDNIFIDTLKPAEDQSGDLILRLYEAKNADSNCVLGINLPVSRVFACDMLENPLEEIQLEEACANLHFHTFEVKTLRLKR